MKLPIIGLMLGLIAAQPAIAAPLALLQPAARLDAETLEAARFDWKSAGLGYVGVWAHDAASCALIDTAPYDGFRIITPTAIASYASTCSIERSEKTSDGFALSGICEGEGERNPTVTQIRIIDDETINQDDADGDLVRCHLPD
ncbi:MAG: hypothetical protein JWR51_1572 [Devosia sp.]|uniref:hypothetical protein n=1 Tax=Devosia sp. TaxID=1871048 RepID=UPI0026167554|nr:hypothetical protein [Devosia sp.]MDB5528469.1 hypothetical protein [Devosia sp.]